MKSGNKWINETLLIFFFHLQYLTFFIIESREQKHHMTP